MSKVKWLIVAVVILYTCYHVESWVAQFYITHRQPAGGGYVVNAVQNIAVAIVILALVCYMRLRLVATGLLLVYVFSLLVQFFSYIYWSYGTQENFSRPLSHLDSVYFTIGTLTTAGTGSLNAISETSRGLQTVQMTIDVVLMVFVVGLVVARFASHFVSRGHPAVPASSTDVTEQPEGTTEPSIPLE
jgi:hypothetical protein